MSIVGKVRLEKREEVLVKDLIRDLRDANRRALDMLKEIRREERFEIKGALGADRKAEIYEEKDIVLLLRDMIRGFRDLMYVLYAQMIEERQAGRSKVYASFRRIIEQELNTLITEIRRMEREEARL